MREEWEVESKGRSKTVKYERGVRKKNVREKNIRENFKKLSICEKCEGGVRVRSMREKCSGKECQDGPQRPPPHSQTHTAEE